MCINILDLSNSKKGKERYRIAGVQQAVRKDASLGNVEGEAAQNCTEINAFPSRPASVTFTTVRFSSTYQRCPSLSSLISSPSILTLNLALILSMFVLCTPSTGCQRPAIALYLMPVMLPEDWYQTSMLPPEFTASMRVSFILIVEKEIVPIA